MVQSGTNGEIGFVLPRRAAAHYRNLYYYAQEIRTHVDSLDRAVVLLEDQVHTRGEQIRLLESQKADFRAKEITYESDLADLKETLRITNEARKHERRWKVIWRTTSIVLAGSTTALLLAR